jgi:EAL domain-containing protein (putative c-di-GMP-specific phosphodiesterase class I)
VETIDQLDWLHAEGCKRLQDFLVSTAKPAADIEQLLLRFGAT